MGGQRELALACYIGARLAAALSPSAPAGVSDADVRAARANGARAWLASAALPAATRVPLGRLIDATGRPIVVATEDAVPRRVARGRSALAATPTGTRQELARAVSEALDGVVRAADAWLDAGARQELQHLSAELTRST